MKKTLYLACAGLLCLLGASAYRLGAHGGGGSPAPLAPAESGQGQPPAPYPDFFLRELGSIPSLEIRLGEEAELPADLCWQDGQDEEEAGDPAARKGGCVRRLNVGPYPANFLAFGSPAPQFFHYNCFQCIELPLLAQHPASGRMLPGVAEAWAEKEGRLYFRLDADARYSNGRPIRAADYALGLLLRFKAGHDSSPAALASMVSELQVLGTRFLVLRLRHPLPLPELQIAPLLHAAEPGFYADFGSDYATRYQDRIPPVTGAYRIAERQRGRMIRLQRVPDFWAAKKKFYRYRYNAESIEHHFLRDEAQAWEFFLRGKLDALQSRNIAAWQRHISNNPALPTDIRSECFECRYPMPPYGIILNAERIPNNGLRRGILQALDMQRAIDVLFRGEGEALHGFAEGYPGLDIAAKEAPYRFDPQAARAAFAAAGYQQEGPDGILCNAEGKRLSLRFRYVPSEKISCLVSILSQSARICGLELLGEPQPWQNNAQALSKGDWEMSFWANMAPLPLPDYRRFFNAAVRSADAPFRVEDAEFCAALDACDAARGMEDFAAACRRVEKRLAELAVWLPAWKENKAYLAYHNRLRFPDCPSCRFSSPGPYELMDAHLYWLEEPSRQP